MMSAPPDLRRNGGVSHALRMLSILSAHLSLLAPLPLAALLLSVVPGSSAFRGFVCLGRAYLALVCLPFTTFALVCVISLSVSVMPGTPMSTLRGICKYLNIKLVELNAHSIYDAAGSMEPRALIIAHDTIVRRIRNWRIKL